MRALQTEYWLDALYNACCAGHLAGVRLVEEAKPTPPAPAPTRDNVVSEA